MCNLRANNGLRPAPRPSVRAAPIAGLVLYLLTSTLVLGVVSAAPASDDWQTREFAKRCEASVAGSDEYVGIAEFERLRRQLEGIAEAEVAPASLRMNLAYQATLRGEHDLAIELLQQLERDLRQHAPSSTRINDVQQMQGINLLLRAEDVNCQMHAGGPEVSGTSCLLPVDPSNVHRQRESAAQARALYLDLLLRNREKSRPQWLWLLNLAASLSGDVQGLPQHLDFSSRLFSASVVERPWVNLGPRLGIAGSDLSGGAILDDFDGDGWLDVVTSSWHPCQSLRAYRQTPSGFVEVTAEWGLGDQLGGLQIRQADYDDDGRLDLLVLRGAWRGEQGRVRNSLLRNVPGAETKTMRFVDVTYDVGLALPAFPTQAAAWADYDGDGDLDLYVGNEGTFAAADPTQSVAGQGSGYASQLFRNDGEKGFVDVARQAGVTNDRFAKGVDWADYDDDGDLDLFVSNVGRNRLYRNQGDGTFRDVTSRSGAGLDADERTFATWFFDYDNDGDEDLFVASYGALPDHVVAAWFGGRAAGLTPRLFRNLGTERGGAEGSARSHAGFEEVSQASGFTRPELIMGSNFGDFDGDGYLDLYLGTGASIFDSILPNVAYRNVGGERFEEVAQQLGLAHLQKGHGVAFGDIDGDGDEDLLQQLGGAYAFDEAGNALYRSPSESRWLVLRLRGKQSNHFGIGSRVRVTVRTCDGGPSAGESRTLHRTVTTGGSFGGNSQQLEIGLGNACAVDEVRIRWAGSDTIDTHRDLALDRYYVATEGGASMEPVEMEERDMTRWR